MSAFANFPVGVSSYGDPKAFFNPYGKVYFVDGNLGNANNDGSSPDYPLLTMAAAFAKIKSGDTIIFRGNITENLTATAGIFDVTIIGGANKPRHADAHTGNNGYSSAVWKPSSASTPNLIIQQQGWTLINILFDCPASAAGVQLLRDAGAGDAERDASHATIYGCRFASGQNGVEFKGGPNFVRIENCTFHDMTAAALVNTTGAGVGTNYVTQILKNFFHNNESAIKLPLNQSAVIGNVIGGFTASTGFGIDLTGGIGKNQVSGNYLSGDYDGDYVAAANDSWAGNFSMDTTSAEIGDDSGITTAVPVA